MGSEAKNGRPQRTQGEIEAAICEGMSKFSQEYLGRGPKVIHTYLVGNGDVVFVRLQGVLTAPEQQLARSLPAGKGRELLKEVRTHLLEQARPLLDLMILDVTGVKVLSLHHDISTLTGEEMIVFTLLEPVSSRKKRNGS